MTETVSGKSGTAGKKSDFPNKCAQKPGLPVKSMFGEEGYS